MRSEDEDLSIGMVWAFAKGSPLTEEFDRFILHCMSSGLHDFWTYQSEARNKIRGARWLRAQKESPVRDKLQEINDMRLQREGLALTSLYGILVLAIIGLAASVVVYFIELIFRYIQSTLGAGCLN